MINQPATILSCQWERSIKKYSSSFAAHHIFQENLFSAFPKSHSHYKNHTITISNIIHHNSNSLNFFLSPMTSCRQLEVRSEDRNPQKWCVPMTEGVFETLTSKSSPTQHTVFGDGSFFSPLLFGKFFDPSDAFPLWEFESDVLLSKLRSASQSTVDWFLTDADYVLKAELPGIGKSSVQVYVEQGKVVEISGQWMNQKEPKTRDWRSGHWWEYGYVRRLELPEIADWRKIEAYVNNDTVLEIRIPKKRLDCDNAQGSDEATKDFESI